MDADTTLSPFRRRGKQVAALLTTAALVAVVAPSVLAGGAMVTRGDFQAFAAGTGLPITGHAQMIRTADGRTIVTVHLEGLLPDTTYGSHVHAAACGVGDANGHYRFNPTGAVTPPNEIWPGPFTTNGAGIGNGNTIAVGTAGPTAVSVVVHAPDSAKLACADLS